MKWYNKYVLWMVFLCCITQHHNTPAWRLFAREDVREEPVLVDQSRHELSLDTQANSNSTAGNIVAGACVVGFVYVNRKDIAAPFHSLGQKARNACTRFSTGWRKIFPKKSSVLLPSAVLSHASLSQALHEESILHQADESSDKHSSDIGALASHDDSAIPHVLNTMQFMEQAGINPDAFFDFSGSDEQNDVHDRMGEYLLTHAHEVLVPDCDDYHLTNPELCITTQLFQQGYATAFELNTQQMAYEAQLMAVIAEDVHAALYSESRIVDGVVQHVKTKLADPKKFCYDLAVKTACIIASGKVLACAAGAVGLVTSPAAVPVGVVVITIGTCAYRCVEWWHAWRVCAEQLDQELAAFNRDDLTPLEKRFVAMKRERASAEFIADVITQEIIDLMENKLAGCAAAATTKIGAFIIQHPKVCVAAGDFKRSILQGAKHSYQSTKERASKGAAWFDRQCVRNPQCSVAGMPDIAVDMGEHVDTVVLLSESTQSVGGAVERMASLEDRQKYACALPKNMCRKSSFKQKKVSCIKENGKKCTRFQTIVEGCHDQGGQGYNRTSLNNYLQKLKEGVHRQWGEIILTKDQIKHLLERHCYSCWDGSIRGAQSCFPPDMGPKEILNLFDRFMSENIAEISKQSAGLIENQILRFTAEIDGQQYTVFIVENCVTTFFPNVL